MTILRELDIFDSYDENEIQAFLHRIRKMGNIGAHMEEDVNLIIDVDPVLR